MSKSFDDLVAVMARLRAPGGCPWDHEQTYASLSQYLLEEAYETFDAIHEADETGDTANLREELGDLLLQVVFHCQLGKERGAFDFNQVVRHITEKLIRRHPHVFGNVKVKDVDQVWANWEKIKRAEKHGTRHARPSALDGIPKHLPALLRAEKLVKKAKRAKLDGMETRKIKLSKALLAQQLFELTAYAQAKGWSAEDLLSAETRKRERQWRKQERRSIG